MIRAFLIGLWEFRSAVTTAYYDHRVPAYEWGREIAHRLTLRRFEA